MMNDMVRTNEVIISGITMPPDAGHDEVFAEAERKLYGIRPVKMSIYRRSVDARRGGVRFVYSVAASLPELSGDVRERLIGDGIRFRTEPFSPAVTGTKKLDTPPVCVGFGPAGMFAALVLARLGYRPLVLEQGPELEARDARVNEFINGGSLNERAKIQFGEGGAGAYSDGKLTTRINDPRCEWILRTFCEFGAPRDIMSEAKPHVGTDRLKPVIGAIRREIIRLGGSVRFNAKCTRLSTRDGKIRGVSVNGEDIQTELVILAIGHSARDTFETLLAGGVDMIAKSFSMGVRIEHRQEELDRALYGRFAGHPSLGPAEYQLTYRDGERVCYSFCMCPGGSVIAAASEAYGIVTNGMSMHLRDGVNANAALAIPVDARGLSGGVLAGVKLQRELEYRAFEQGGGSYAAPVQQVGDFLNGRASKCIGGVKPTYPIGVVPCAIDNILASDAADTLRSALRFFGKKIKGFDTPEAIITAPETRTSSPVRILRSDSMFSSSLDGLIPCGEGAGYAGGIMSAAADGIKAAEAVASIYKPAYD